MSLTQTNVKQSCQPRTGRAAFFVRGCGHKAIDRFNSRHTPEPNSGCWLWESCLNHQGYGFFFLDGGNIGAHKASWILHRGPVESGLFVLHKCDVRSCVNPAHLFLGTPQDNSDDMVAKCRSAGNPGEKNRHAKLTENDVRTIRLLAGDGVTTETLAGRFEITSRHCAKIISGSAWKHVTLHQTQDVYNDLS